jgi:hypothetical protein
VPEGGLADGEDPFAAIREYLDKVDSDNHLSTLQIQKIFEDVKATDKEFGGRMMDKRMAMVELYKNARDLARL